jgi:hypothetical protein
MLVAALRAVAVFLVRIFPDLVTTIAGVALGMWGSLRLDRRRDERARETELKTVLRSAIQANLLAAPELLMSDHRTPVFQLDVALIDDVMPQLVAVSSDMPLPRSPRKIPARATRDEPGGCGVASHRDGKRWGTAGRSRRTQAKS